MRRITITATFEVDDDVTEQQVYALTSAVYAQVEEPDHVALHVPWFEFKGDLDFPESEIEAELL
jgi:hypothetical protein